MQLKNVFHYREIPPPEDLGHLVLSFWEFTVDAEAGGPIGHEIFPDGCISLLYRRNERLRFAGLITTELHTRSVTVPVYGGDIFRECARALHDRAHRPPDRNPQYRLW